MRQVAKDTMDVKSMIEYIVDGLPDEKRNKLTLYQATTYDELKEKLKVYKTFLTESAKQDKTSRKAVKNNDGIKNGKDGPEKKCFNCGGKGHTKVECPDASRGRKCYNCDSFGHISKDCRRPKKQRDPKPTTTGNATNSMTMMCVVPEPTNKMNLLITIGQTNIEALFDTGSPYTVMRRSLYASIPRLGRWITQKIGMRGRNSTRLTIY